MVEPLYTWGLSRLREREHVERWEGALPPPIPDRQAAVNRVVCGGDHGRTTFHSGRWAWRLPNLKVWRVDGGARLCSEFLISGNRAAQMEALDALRRERAARSAATG